MEAVRELVGQVATQAGLTEVVTKRAIYLATLARDQRTLGEAARVMRLKESTIRGYCKRFDITLKDFDPFPPAKFPIRPRPKDSLTAHAAGSGDAIFTKRETRETRKGRCPHTTTATAADGKVYCVDCGRKPPKPKREDRT